jgi:hypothetical protein
LGGTSPDLSEPVTTILWMEQLTVDGGFASVAGACQGDAMSQSSPEWADPAPVDLISICQAVATMPAHTVVSHRSAAILWGLWIPPFAGVEVTTPATSRASRATTGIQRRPVAAHRRILPPDEVTARFGLAVTTLERTWLDLAALLDPVDLVAAGDSALRAGASRERLHESAIHAKRVRRIVRARQTALMLDERSRSRPESRLRAAIVFAGLPTPRVNQAISDGNGGWLAEPDLAYDEARLALEYNGADHAGLGQMRKDSQRLLDLQRAGWTVRTYTAVHAFRRLDQVVDDVRSILLRRAPELITATIRRSA